MNCKRTVAVALLVLSALVFAFANPAADTGTYADGSICSGQGEGPGISVYYTEGAVQGSPEIRGIYEITLDGTVQQLPVLGHYIVTVDGFRSPPVAADGSFIRLTMEKLAAGTHEVVVTHDSDPFKAVCLLHVGPSVESVLIPEDKYYVSVGGSFEIIPTVLPADAPVRDVVWTASGANVSVDGGTITGVTAGTVTLTVTTVDGGKTDTCTVEVIDIDALFDPCGGTVTPESKPIVYGSAYGELPVPVRAGYEFAGWYTLETGGDRITAESVVAATADQTLYAHWTPNQYTVHFDSMGGSAVNDKTVVHGSTYGDMPTPVYPSYKFVGWFTDADAGTLITSSSRVEITDDQTLFARWERDVYTVIYNGNGFDGGKTDNQEMAFGKEYALSDCGYTRTGYTFSHWNTVSDGSGQSYEAGQTVRDITDLAVITLYAIWTPNQYTVHFDGNTANSGSMEDQVFTYDAEPQPLRMLGFGKEGYEFTGWNTAANGTGTGYADGESVSNIAPGGKITLYAQWSIGTYTVLFESDPGVEYCRISGVYGTKVTVPDNPVKVGYEFSRWSEVPPETIPGHNVTITAVWTANKYTVVFDGNGADDGITPSQNFDYGTPKNLYLNRYTRVGYTFSYWNTMSDGTGQSYQDGQAVQDLTTSGKITLYAIWTPNQYTVTFQTVGTPVPSKTVTYDKPYGTLGLSVYEGYDFGGWYLDSDFEQPVDADTIVRTDHNHSLYAKWVPGKYTVIFNSNGGTGTMESQTLTYTVEENLSPNKFEKNGYTFRCWNTEATGLGTEYADGAAVKNLVKSGSIVLFAMWDPNEYLIQFNGNGESRGTMPPIQTVYDGDPVVLPDNVFERDGYTFSHWNTRPNDLGDSYDDGATVRNVAYGGTFTLYAIWTANTYTVHFDSGEGTPVDDITVTFGSMYLDLAIPEREGYSFAGWFNDAGEEVIGTTLVTTPSDHTLYAHWAVMSYSVVYKVDNMVIDTFEQEYGTVFVIRDRYDKEGYTSAPWTYKGQPIEGEFTMPAEDVLFVTHLESDEFNVIYYVGSTILTTQQCKFDTEVQVLPDFTYPGYTISSWKLPEGLDKPVFRMPACDVIITADFTPNKYTVHFDANGGTPAPEDKTVTYGEAYGILPDVTRPGYTMTGWYDDNNNQIKEYMAVVILEDQTLHASWEQNTYNVLFDANGGFGAMEKLGLIYDDEPVPLTANKFKRTGYTFSHWNTSYDDSGDSYQNMEPVKNLALSGQITLFAIWTANTYTVHFDSNDPHASTVESITVTYDQPYGELPLPVLKGYTHLGWFTDSVAGDRILPDTVVSITSDEILYAHWQANEYRVVFDPNGPVTGSMDPVTMVYDRVAFLPDLGFERAGYKFLAWYLNPECTGTLYENKAPVVNLAEDGTVTLFAKWSNNAYTIKFDPNGATAGSTPPQDLEYDDNPVPLRHNGYIRNGYRFTGWDTMPDGTGVHYDNDEPVRNVTSGGTITLYAQWEANKYTLSFDTDGGKPMESVTVTFDSPYGAALKVPEKLGYTFIEWRLYGDDGGYSVIVSQTPVKVYKNHTLTAFWNVNHYEVVFNGNKSTDGSMDNISMTYDQDGTVPVCGYTRTGYTFRSWNTDMNGNGDVYRPGDVMRNLTDKGTFTMYAQWTANDFTVEFDSTGGSEVNSKDVTYGESYGDLPVPVMEGHTFDGWRTSLGEDGDLVWSTSSVTITENQKLYATWVVNTYTVVFYGNGASYGSVFSQLFVFDVPQKLSPNMFVKNGYSFAGWNTMPDGSGRAYADCEEVTNLASSDIANLYAQWVPLEFVLHFDSAGGSEVDDIIVYYDGYYGELPVPVKDGFIFAGWFDEDGTQICPEDRVRLTGEQTLFAKWVVSVVHVDRVQLNRDLVVMYVGEPGVYLIPVINPENATDKRITWASSDDSIVSVDSEGNLTAHDFGSVTVTVTTADGGHTAACTVLVNRINEVAEGGELSESQVNQIMEQLETFDLHGITPVMTLRSADSESISVPAKVMAELIRQHGKIDMSVSNGSRAEFNWSSLYGIDFAGGETMLFTIKHVTDASGPDSQMITNGTVYDITLLLDGRPVTEFNDPFNLALYYEQKEGESSDNIRLFHLGVQGTEVVKQYWFDSEDDFVTFATGHLSRYAIVYVDTDDSIISAATAVSVILIVLILFLEMSTLIKRKHKLRADSEKSDRLIEEFQSIEWHKNGPRPPEQ